MLCHTIYNSNSNVAVQTTITIFDDLTLKCHYYEKEVKSCSILSSLPSHICNDDVVSKVIKKLSVAHVSIGNCDDKFEEIVEHRKGKFLSLSGETAATIDSHEIAFQDRTISNTIRQVECDIFVDTDGQCKTCRNYRPILRAMYHRYKQTALAENVSSSRTNSKTYTLTKLKECQARLQVAEEQLAKAQQISDQYIEVDEEVHNDLLTIINENAADINKALPKNSFSQSWHNRASNLEPFDQCSSHLAIRAASHKHTYRQTYLDTEACASCSVVLLMGSCDPDECVSFDQK